MPAKRDADDQSQGDLLEGQDSKAETSKAAAKPSVDNKGNRPPAHVPSAATAASRSRTEMPTAVPEANPHPAFERMKAEREARRTQTRVSTPASHNRPPMPKVLVQVTASGAGAYQQIMRDSLGWPVMHREQRTVNPRTRKYEVMLVQDPNGTKHRMRQNDSLDIGSKRTMYADEATGLLFAGYVICLHDHLPEGEEVPKGFLTSDQVYEQFPPPALLRMQREEAAELEMV